MNINKKMIEKLGKVIEGFSEDMTLQTNTDELLSRQMERSQIALIEFSIPKSKITSYDGKDSLIYTVKLKNFNQVLSKIKDKEVSLELGDNIKISGSKTKATLSRVMDGSPLSKTMTLQHQVVFEIKKEEFLDAIEQVSIFSPHAKMILDDTFIIAGDGDGGEGVEVNTLTVLTSLNEKPKKPLVYAVNYIGDFLRNLDKETVVKVSLGEQGERPLPIKLEGKVEGVDVRFFLAPRMETD